ncbi:hypothetical protein B484DRAFT_31514 [Ochromonadaceae sp. CCMP2298]|nr:hypothetical protein B484DRAFT_31514 [Ochromonadaceae sp. CCMP2298]
MAEAAKMKHAKLPLMDEVNELIEKERILLNLKLLEKKGEAEQWKNKYDLLFDTLNNPGAPAPGAPGAPVEALEAAAEIESNSNYASSHEVHTLVYERLYSWILDLSGVRMERLMFAKLCKVVFGARGGIEELTIAVLSRCSLGDDHCAALMALFRCASLSAVFRML